MNRITEIITSLTCGKYIPKQHKNELSKITVLSLYKFYIKCGINLSTKYSYLLTFTYKS